MNYLFEIWRQNKTWITSSGWYLIILYYRKVESRSNASITSQPNSKWWKLHFSSYVCSDDSSICVAQENHLEFPKLVIREKEQKIKPYIRNYDFWWLILVDLIGHGLREYDMDQLNGLTVEQNIFDKII